MSLRALQGPTGGGAPVGGTGTTNYIPRWNPGPSTLGDSRATDDGTTFVVGSGAYAGTALPGGMQLKTTVPIYVATDGTRTTIIGTDGTTSCFVGSLTNHNFQIRASNATAITVQPAGNVGIGTANPQEKAQVYGNLKIGVTASDSFLTFGDEGTASRFNGIYRPASSNTLSIGSYNLITFNVSTAALGSQTERARIDSTGRVLVGTSTAPSSVSVGFVQASTTGGMQWQNGSAGGCAVLPSANTATWYVHVNAMGLESYTLSHKAISTGLDVSTAGYGVKLPATPGNGNANTLDSYQEGTRVLSAGDLSGWTYVTATQYWTLVGRTVTLHTVFTGGTSSATGGATIATPPLLTPLRIAAGAAVNSSGTALGNGVCVVASTSSTTGTVITSNAISSSAVDKVLTVTYETAGL